MKPAIVLFNHTLRLFDHPALVEAAGTGKPLILAYLLDEKGLGSSHRFWLHASLRALSEALTKRGAQLVISSSLAPLIKESGADLLFYTAAKHGEKKAFPIESRIFSPNLLIDPEKVKTGQGGFFKVFTPFYRRCLADLSVSKPLSVPTWKKGKRLRSHPLPSPMESPYWLPGEEAGNASLRRFVKEGLTSYATLRDRLDREGTSRLSPYLRWGELSVRSVWHATKKSTSFQRELIFREFAYYLLHTFPRMATENFNARFDTLDWENASAFFSAWKKGKTGYPIVDASMRCLLETGWMHNRARMITGSFLVKDLLIDWRKGERWFWEQLVDGDPALNAFNWQWVAGTGADAAPYFRIFNPISQGEKFDPNGDFVRKWVPELAHIKGKAIHAPVDPLVEHAYARKRALARFSRLKVR